MTTSSPYFEHLFDKTKTVCFGRFLVDIPLSAQVVYGPTEAPLLLERHPGKAASIDQIVAARLIEIEKDRYRAYDHLRGQDSMLGKVVSGAVARQKIVFGVSPGGGDFYRIESYLPAGEDLFVQKINPYGEKTQYEKAIQKINAIARLFRPRSESEIPAEPGLCVDGGFIRDSEELTHENFRLGIRLAEFPDVHFSIAAIKKDFLVESDAIEPRLLRAEDEAKRAGNGAWYARIKILRRGQNKIGNWSGFEILTRKPAQATEKESHEFVFLSQGEPKNAYLPVLDVKLHTGVRDNRTGQVKPSITDEEALMLWDRVIKSIRVRAIDNARGQPTAQRSEPGTLVLAGAVCPRSGWWSCADGDGKLRVEFGERQYFAEGCVMPQATLLGQQSVWQKIKLEQSRYNTENPTVWTLVEADRPA